MSLSTLRPYLDRIPDPIKDEMITRIINWDGNWFEEYQQDSSTHNQKKLPSILQKVVASPKHLSCCELQAVPITSSFTDDKQYLERFKALITLELWESLCSSSVQPQWSALGTIHQATLTATMRCIVKLSQSKLEMLQENDVLLLSIKSSVIKETQRIPAVVLKATVVPSSEKNTRAHTLGITNYNGMLLEFDLLVNQSSSFKSITPSTRLTVEVSKMGSFNQSAKQMKAMSSLAEKNASLLQIIMNPTDYSHAFENDIYITTARTGSSIRMNANQYKAVESISSMVTSNSKDARIALLQGPPGTGKTEVIAEIVRRVIQANETSQPSPAVLVCAPSNLAVDNIAVRLQQLSGGDRKQIRMVRVGLDSNITNEVKKISLNHLTELRHQENVLRKTSFQSKKAERLRRELANLIRDIKNEEKQKHPSERRLERYHVEREEFERDIKKAEKLHANLFENLKWETRLQILEEADVIFATLSTSGNPQMERVFSRQNDPRKISCCIIDEASQCTEPEFSIPLSLGHGINKVIMVGDPKQLPATVLSQAAIDCGYAQSMYNRMFKSLVDSGFQDCVQMLNTQYRMAEEICRWPSLYFYDNQLMTPSNLDRQGPIIPYLVINLTDGEEGGRGAGKFNKKEADLVISIIKFLSSASVKKSVGVVTYYKDQKHFIESAVRTKCQQMTKFVEVNTVDSFQGKEKDIIILSTVRAGRGGIGFVQSPNRMCVAMTRSRETQIVVTHFPTFERNKDWRRFIDDARRRGAARDVVSTDCSEAYLTDLLMRN